MQGRNIKEKNPLNKKGCVFIKRDSSAVTCQQQTKNKMTKRKKKLKKI